MPDQPQTETTTATKRTRHADGLIHVGDKVVYRGGETHQEGATIGVYTLHSTDEVTMHGYVEVMDINGNIFPILASLLEAAPYDD